MAHRRPPDRQRGAVRSSWKRTSCFRGGRHVPIDSRSARRLAGERTGAAGGGGALPADGGQAARRARPRHGWHVRHATDLGGEAVQRRAGLPGFGLQPHFRRAG